MARNQQAILVVDDRPANLIAMAHTLNETGVKIVTAQNGEQALAATLDQDFALAILDVQMPGMDGYELAELMRGNPETHSMPIVFLTAFSAEDWQVFKGYESGAVDYIIKPFNPHILLSKVRVFLEMHAQKRELENSQRELAAVNRELESFAYSVSHDLQAPLRNIEGFSEALAEDCLGQLDERCRDYLGRISSEAERMAKLIQDLLRLSRITRAQMEMRPVDLSAVASEVMDRLRLGEPEREAEVDIAEGLMTEGDPVLLSQALENLLSNAWKFTGKAPRTNIQVGAQAINGETAFFVRDNGVGFDAQHADKLFAPFQRLHSQQDFPGTGIGLSSVQRVVARHAGRVWCKSMPGAGATFYFTLGPHDRRQA